MKPQTTEHLCKRRVFFLMFVALLFGGIGFALNGRPEPLDLSEDEFPFNSIKMPPRSVEGDAFLDGGSVSVTVVDQGGKTFHFAFPHDSSKGGSAFNEAFHGAGHVTDPGAVPLRNVARAKEVALGLMDDYGGTELDGLYYHLSETEPPFHNEALHGLLSAFK
jgi:hypothetical protein